MPYLHPKIYPNRKHPTHGVFLSPSLPTIVFVTICTKDRKPWLAQSTVHQALVKIWHTSTAWLVGRYVLMPDHLHFFCAPYDSTVRLGQWIAYWKAAFTRMRIPGTGLWQRGYWDRRLRKQESYSEKWAYVRENPVRKGLCHTPDQWPYQGEIFPLGFFA